MLSITCVLNFILSTIIIININNKNQIYLARIKNYEQDTDKYIHFSIDDVIDIFADITHNSYNSIFENKTLKYLKELNELYGSKFSMYCFYEFDNNNLSECTDKYKEQFEENSYWLKFGFHALNSERDYSKLSEKETIDDYNKVIAELKRIVGEKSITTVVRMEKFTCNKKNIIALANLEELPITGLLGADTVDRTDYYLNKEQNEKLFSQDYYNDDETGIYIYNTDYRIERIEGKIESTSEMFKDKNLIIFTHEWILNNENKNKINEICKYGTQNGYIYKFPEKI